MLTAQLPFETETVLNVMGTRCRTIVSGAMTDGKYAAVHVEVDQAGAGVPEHTHVLEDEIFHVLAGRIRVTLGERTVEVAAGQTAFGPRGVPHSWIALEPTTMIVAVTPSGLEELFVDLDALGEAQRNPAEVGAVCERYRVRFA